MAKLLTSDKENSAEATVRDTVSAVKRFQGETEQSDDITVLALRFQADPATESTAVLHMIVKNELSEIANVNAKFEKFAISDGSRHGFRRQALPGRDRTERRHHRFGVAVSSRSGEGIGCCFPDRR